VKPDPYAHRAVRVTALDRDRGGGGVARAREGREELLAARVHDLAALRRDRLAHEPPVLGEQDCVLGTKPLEQLGRALDVGEHERHRPGRQRPHGSSVRPPAGMPKQQSVTWARSPFR
jgi:hypothetical protein